MRLQKIITIILICLVFLGHMVNASAGGFARYKGKALSLDIPIYEGTPLSQYPYRSLGYVKGEYGGGFFDTAASTIFKALKNLADNAKMMGANAVIKVKGHSKGLAFSYDGEAVIFDSIPK